MTLKGTPITFILHFKTNQSKGRKLITNNKKKKTKYTINQIIHLIYALT